MKKIDLNSIRWMLIHFSTFMMAFTPVIDGYAAEKAAKEMNEARVKEILIGMGMTKSQTVGDFWNKNKSQFPPRIQKLVTELFAKHKNDKMPGVEVASAKGPEGQTVPVVRMQLPGHLMNIEVHNNDKYFARVGPTELTNIDINNFTDMFEKMYYNDPQFRRWVDSQNTTTNYQSLGMSVASVKNEFSLPAITAEMWKKMTPEGRVQYIMNMRNLWKDAMVVLANRPGQKVKSNSKKTSSVDIMEEIWKLLNPDAEAETQTSGKVKPVRGQAVGTTGAITDYANACLIAGYVVDYKGKGTTCNADDVKKRYNDGFYQETHAKCTGANQIACNPMIYGTPGGNPVCVTIDSSSKSDFQVATHFSGPCERGNDPNHNNQLSSEIKFLKESGDSMKNSKRYGKDNELLDADALKKAIREEQAKSEKPFEQTKYFLDGVMKSKFPGLVAMFNEGKIDDKVIEALKEIRTGFDEQIKEARKACKASASTGRRQETNFWGACDQLHRREIFVADYLAANVGCPDKGATIDNETLKCKCPDNIAKGKFAFPGQSCGGTVETCKKRNADGSCADPIGGCGPNGQSDGRSCAPTPDQACKNAKMESGKLSDGKPEVIICTCPGKKAEAPLSDITSGQFKCPPVGGGGGVARPAPGPAADNDPSCAAAEKTKCDAVENGKKGDWQVRTASDGATACRCVRGDSADEGDGWWKRNKENVIMTAIAGVAILALIKSAPKKPGITPPGDTCTGGQSACPGVCTNVNQVKVNGVCQCREAGPGRKLIDATTCEYETDDGTTTTQIKCPDNSTMVTNISSCPKQTCSDGSTVYVGQTCPTETPSTKPTSTTTTDVKK